MIEPNVSEFEINDGANSIVRISIDLDADLGVQAFLLRQEESYIYVTLDGLRALVKAAEQLKR